MSHVKYAFILSLVGLTGCYATAKREGDGVEVGVVVQEEVLQAFLDGSCYTSSEDGQTWCKFKCGDPQKWCEGRIDPDTIRRIEKIIDENGGSPSSNNNRQSMGAGGYAHVQQATSGPSYSSIGSVSYCEGLPSASPYASQSDEPAFMEAGGGGQVVTYHPKHSKDWLDGTKSYEELYEELFEGMDVHENGISGWLPLEMHMLILGENSVQAYMALPWDYSSWGPARLYDDDDGIPGLRYAGMCTQEQQHLANPCEPGAPLECWLEADADIGVIELAGNAKSILQWMYDRIQPNWFSIVMEDSIIPGHGVYSEVNTVLNFDYSSHSVVLELSTDENPDAHFSTEIQLLP